ncbi:helix-turn-helix transcriptional regulator [Pseudonocardia zijingensis]|jgi:transcriptional regulator with XRE-family HTH domain|uniref:Helix-turn-helix transcriptional regulator n=2 Tax=Pseudonocardia zijingensis TaxID=153376 RepID=A0ABN1N713_9PSEU
MSQLELATATGVSTKHLSFVENGRARPSRQLLVHLADALEMPLPERDRLLLAGGYAPPQGGPGRPDRAMRPVREALDRLLAAHDPHPAIVVDARWDLVAANAAADLLWDGVDPALLTPPVNMLRLSTHPEGLPRISTATPACSRSLIARLRRLADEDADDALLDLVVEAEGYLTAAPGEPPRWTGDGVMAGFELKTRLGVVGLQTVIATLGAPLDVGASDLALETFLPVDEDSAALLRALAATRPVPAQR